VEGIIARTSSYGADGTQEIARVWGAEAAEGEQRNRENRRPTCWVRKTRGRRVSTMRVNADTRGVGSWRTMNARRRLPHSPARLVSVLD
jgi:hypothetical protein